MRAWAGVHASERACLRAFACVMCACVRTYVPAGRRTYVPTYVRTYVSKTRTHARTNRWTYGLTYVPANVETFGRTDKYTTKKAYRQWKRSDNKVICTEQPDLVQIYNHRNAFNLIITIVATVFVLTNSSLIAVIQRANSLCLCSWLVLYFVENIPLCHVI